MKRLALALVLLTLSTVPISAGTLTAAEAKNHVGENATVCGVVASVHLASGSNGSPTFVNLDKPYPNHIFTVLIWGDDLPKFKENPVKWEGKKACATGTITSYRGLPEIVANPKTRSR